MNELELLAGFKATFKACGLQKIVESAVSTINVEQFLSSVAHDCVEVVRSLRSDVSSVGVEHPLAKLAAQTKLERAVMYEHEGCQVAMNLPYGAASILTELYKKLMGLIIADKTGKLTLEGAKEGLKDLTVWEELLWDYLEKQEG